MNRTRFRSLLRAVLLAAPSAALGCDSMADPTPMPERAECVDLKATTRYARLTLGAGVDGIAFATRDDGGNTTRLPSLGTPCGTASDRAACEARVEALLGDPASEGWPLPYASVHDLAVITVGDDVRLATLKDVLTAATPVETLDEAAAFVTLRGPGFDCGANNARTEPDGFTFKSTDSVCEGVFESFTKVYASTGEVAHTGTRPLSENDDDCVVAGRRPASLTKTGAPWLSSAPACVAELAHMEAAAMLGHDAE